MDIKTMDQGLLQRNPSMTQEEFNHHWLHNHAPLVIPFFLHSGLQHYEQIHGPLHALSSNPAPALLTLLTTHSGAVGFPPQSVIDDPPPMPKWKQDYYTEVIKADERRFLVSEALDHIVRVEPESVGGERKVVIEGGKVMIEVKDEVWRVWREYEERGKEEEGDR